MGQAVAPHPAQLAPTSKQPENKRIDCYGRVGDPRQLYQLCVDPSHQAAEGRENIQLFRPLRHGLIRPQPSSSVVLAPLSGYFVLLVLRQFDRGL
jgi:hypothetical protein